MKKKLFAVVLVVAFIVAFLFFGTYKSSPQELVKNDGLQILSSVESISISDINIFPCIVDNSESENSQLLMYVTEEKTFLGKTFYKAITSHLCNLENINDKESISENSLATYIDEENIVYYGILPEECENVFINGKNINVEKRTINIENKICNFNVYYGVFNESEIITESYYFDLAGEKHPFDLDVLYF